jgi:polyphosphate kinase
MPRNFMSQAVREFALPENESAEMDLPFSLLHDRRFLFNRELSWLEFNRRVLEEALDESHPLLERLKFLSIFSTNLDEFFMIRVSGLKEQMSENVAEVSPDGMTVAEQLKEIRERLKPMLAEQMMCLREDVLPRLAAEGITIWPYDSLNKDEQKNINEYFLNYVFPVLTPQAVDASHPFPYVSNLSLNLGLTLIPADISGSETAEDSSELRFARIKLPPNVSRLVPVGDSGIKFTLLGEVIAANVDKLFPGMMVIDCHMFRVTRDADIELREDEAGDLLRTMEQELRRKRHRFPVRLEVHSAMPDEMVKFFAASIGLAEDDVYRINGVINIPDLMHLYGLNVPELRDKPIPVVIPPAFRQKKNVFEVIRQGDVLLHHPFMAYSSVTDFVSAAASDPDVQAIKICLYRTGKDSPVIKALMRASERGKQVAALVELKARFDEENNIEWARKLEKEGVHVVYGLRGLKTHCKLALVIRREGNQLRRYVHFATGNYNPTTSRIYTDIGILTADEEIGADATDLFNYLTGYSKQTEYRNLLVAPVNLRKKFIALIRREADLAMSGRPARIIAKINSLTDVDTVRELYLAAQAGVQIDLLVRGVCVLRPGIEGLSENIRVTSVVGRFLEHSRIFYFQNGGDEELFIGSADLMQRNLDRRVEVIAPVKSSHLRKYLKEAVLETYLNDNFNARILRSDGDYERVRSLGLEARVNAQLAFIGQEV